jgi:hypothetical protein
MKSEAQREWQKSNPKKVAEYARRWRKKNPEKNRACSRRWAANNPERAKELSRRSNWKSWGIDMDTLPPKPECCQCCGRKRRLVMDHDHCTGQFRGWICVSCNNALGQFGDTIEGLEQALHYLRRALQCQLNA